MRSARAIAALVVACGVGGAFGCSKLIGANFDDPTIAPGPSGLCALPSAGDARVRFGDFVPTADRVDFCLTRTDGASPVDGVPILSSSGGACPPGVGYEQVLASITVPSGTYRVDVVPAGHACTSSTASGTLTIAPGGSASVVVLGDGKSSAPVVLSMPDVAPPPEGSTARFVHAIAGAGNLDFGASDAAELPSKLTPLVSNVAFATAGGYVDIGSLGAKPALGAAPASTTATSLVTSPSIAPGHAYSIFAAGSATDVAFPAELYVCDDTATSGFFVPCGGVPFDVTLDSFNAYLWGPFAPLEGVRRQPIIDAIGNFTSDVVCLTDVDSDDDKRAIVAAASSRFPYALWFADDVSTPIDDPTDQNGAVPPPVTTPACPAGSSVATELDSLLSCLETNCSTVPNDASGTILDTGVSCIESKCSSEAAALVVESGPDGQQCWMCVLAQLYGRTNFSTTGSACKTDPKARLGFHGQSTTLLLSRFPLTDTAQWVLPSTSIRASILRASMALQNGAALDVYCVQPTTPQDGTIVPYTGQYGNGQTGNLGWRQELLLQAEKMVSYVGATSGAKKRRALVSGDFSTGPGSSAFNAINPESFAELGKSFTLAAPAEYTPACTFCASNPILTKPGVQPQIASNWTVYTMLSDIPVTDVASASIILDAPVIPYSGYEIPLSAMYAFRSTVHVRP